jgi:hypothetical protein
MRVEAPLVGPTDVRVVDGDRAPGKGGRIADVITSVTVVRGFLPLIATAVTTSAWAKATFGSGSIYTGSSTRWGSAC